MNSIICTLFEGSYHYGVAALTNSLYNQGYRGAIYAGYRGALPPWAAMATENLMLAWPGLRTLRVADGLQIHFLPIDTPYHLANYKPDLMLRLLDNLVNEATAIFYFDPDIVVTTPWVVFEDWITHGVALCEDIISPKAQHHPIRAGWRLYFGTRGFQLSFKDAVYANSGFVGLTRANREFLATWQAIQEAMAPAIGGLGISFLSTLPNSLPFAPFSIPDQDAMNAAVEAWEGNVSFIDKAGMAFISRGSLMSHAIGKGKPWARNLLAHTIAGEVPRRADRDYWHYANGLIVSQPAGLVRRRQLVIQVAALIGRFYTRN